MNAKREDIPGEVLKTLERGVVIPAHVLALKQDRTVDTDRQRALTRYYVDAGVGGLAVGVHTTQIAIRSAGLYEPVLRLAADTAREWTDRPLVLIGGVAGRTSQAVKEAEIARGLGYHLVLLNLSALQGASDDEVLEHCRRVSEAMPLVGFYLAPAFGGIVLSEYFWTQFAQIENVVAIKIAVFDRYGTLDVIRGVVRAGAENRITLYTGNDDNIVGDLLTPFTFERGGERITVRVKGGLLGHWSFWTLRAVEILNRIHRETAAGKAPLDLLALNSAVTDCNAAIYDAAHNFRGCIPGCHEVLRRQGLFAGTWCLDPSETLSPGQSESIDRVYAAYPEMNDDSFVRANLDRWFTAERSKARAMVSA
jgi:hypothetical protein